MSDVKSAVCGGLRSRRALAVAGLGVLTLVVGCIHPDLGAGVLTPDTANPDDSYNIALDEDTGLITTSAPGANTGGNLRMAFWRKADTATLDQQSCATWVDRDPTTKQQQGAALRIRRDGDRTRAITVTQNVWANWRPAFNVHVMDSAPDGGGGATYTKIGTATLSLPPAGTPAYPLRMCARVVGDEVSFVVWPADQPQPAWGTEGAGGSATLPAGWNEPGIPGLYIGHLAPGESVGFADLEVAALP